MARQQCASLYHLALLASQQMEVSMQHMLKLAPCQFDCTCLVPFYKDLGRTTLRAASKVKAPSTQSLCLPSINMHQALKATVIFKSFLTTISTWAQDVALKRKGIFRPASSLCLI
jgi:hypothetical protein